MGNKRVGLFLALMAALMLTACGEAASTVGNVRGTQEDKQDADAQPSAQAGEEDSAKSGGEEENASAAADQGGSEEGYVFTYRDITMSVDTDAAPVLEALGEAKSYYEAASCAFEGLDKIYTYNDFEIYTYPAGDKDMISGIIFRSDIVSTPEGIAIGADAAKVKEIYGEGLEEEGNLVYEKGGMRLSFVVQEDKVASIEYQSTALD